MIYDVPAWLRITQIESVTTRPDPVEKPEPVKKKRKKRKKPKNSPDFDFLCERFKYACDNSVEAAAEKYGVAYTTISKLVNGGTYPEVKKAMNARGYKYDPCKVTDDMARDAYKLACLRSNMFYASKVIGINSGYLHQIIKGNLKPHIKIEMDKQGYIYDVQKCRIPERDIVKAFIQACRTKKIRQAAKESGIHMMHLRRILNGERRPEIAEKMRAKGYIWNNPAKPRNK